ncbi:MAG: hypothetical protein EBR58_11090, partial [Betaproteobacteria bacterium]|nr:hypothetical protein [Betaproteobacteria bacterium]
MSTTNIAGLTVGKPAAWLMALPPLAANAVCAVAYVLVATLVHLLFALPNPLLVAGTAASGVAVAGALMCGRKVLPGLWLARLLWDLWLLEGTPGSSAWALATLGACTLVLQTEVARVAVLALQILPSKLRRLRKSLQICGAGLLASSVGTALYLLVLSQMQEATAVQLWSLQAAGLLLPEWAGIALLLPLTILWLQDDAWQEPRKWRVSTLVALSAGLTLGVTARAVWMDEQQTLARLRDSNTALAQRLDGDFRSAHQAVQILQSHLRHARRESAAQFSDVAAAIQASHPHVQALSWNPLIPHEQRLQFEQRLRNEYGPQAALVDRATDGTLIPSRKADFYVAVEHIAPLEKNRAALGLNIHANPARRAAIDQALRSGEPAITPRIQLVQETGKSWGALYLSPVAPARTQISTDPKPTPVGFAVAVLRMEDIVGSAVERLRFANFRLASGEAPRRRVVHYQFVDQNEPAETQALFEDGQAAKPPM